MNDNTLTKEEAELLIISITDKQFNIENYTRFLELENGRIKEKHIADFMNNNIPRMMLNNTKIINENKRIWDNYQAIKDKIRNQYNLR